MIELIKVAFVAQITLAELSVNEDLNKEIKIAEKWLKSKI